MKVLLSKYYKIWLPIISIILFFSIIEFICRVIDLTDNSDVGFKFYIRHVDNDIELPYMIESPLFMWSLMPDFSYGSIKINSKGYRDKEYNIKKDKNSFRILVLGDSSTFGIGVNSLTKTYHSLLEEKLNNDYNSKINFEVINGGVTGYTSYQGLQIYKHKFSKYNADIVTFYFGINDPIERFYLNDKQIINVKNSKYIKILNNYMIAKSAFYRSISKMLLNYKTKTSQKVQRVSIEDYGKNIIEMNELCKNNGSVLLLISPLLNNKKYDKRREKIIAYRKELERISKQHNIPLLTIGKLTEKSNTYNDMFFSDSVHPNEHGNKILMQSLIFAFSKLNLIKVPIQ